MRFVIATVIVAIGGASMGCSKEAPPAAKTQTPITATAPAPTEAAVDEVSPEALVVKPGVGIGDLELGMTREQVLAAHPSLEPDPPSALADEEWLVGAPFEVHLVQGKVELIRVKLSETKGVTVHSTSISSDAPESEAVAALRGCGERDLAIGGSTTTCEDGAASVLAAGPVGIVYFQVHDRG